MLTQFFAEQAIAWLLTYLLHGTLLLGLAWLVSKPLSRWSVAAEETVWKLALVGALFTATLQLAGWEPVAGRWGLADLTAPAVQAEEAAVPVPSVSRSVPVRVRPIAAAAPSQLPEAPAASFRLTMPSLPVLALGAWAFGAFLLLARYARSFARLGRRLRSRLQVVGGTLYSRLRTLAAEAGFQEEVRLTCSSRVPVPLALGLRRPEICVPPKALAGLTDEQQEGMLAHELAHLARRDPLWLVISHVLACVFFFQPLNWVARRRLREISEMLSDEWAVTRTGRPLSLAGCLAEVAGWSAARRSLPVPGMADRPSHLAQRIRRLLDGRSPESPARRIWLGAAMVVLLIAVAAAAPAVSAARQEASSKPDVKAVQSSVSAASEPGEHDVAEEPVYAGDEDDDVDLDDMDADVDDIDVDLDLDDLEPDIDLDIDYNDIVESTLASVEGMDLDAMIEGSLAGMDASLEALDVQLEEMSHDHALTEEEQEKLEEEIERTNERIERTLRPRLEQLSREITEKVQRDLPTAEMGRLAEEMRAMAERMRPSHEEMARLHALVDEEMRKHRADGELSREERQRIAREAREMAERMRPTEEERKALEDLRRQHRELAQKYRADHRAEIEKATREMREEIQRETQAAREELRRSMDQRRQIERQERRDRLERDRDRDRDSKGDKEESGKEKPPKMVLRIDMWGNIKLVPETPGC